MTHCVARRRTAGTLRARGGILKRRPGSADEEESGTGCRFSGAVSTDQALPRRPRRGWAGTRRTVLGVTRWGVRGLVGDRLPRAVSPDCAGAATAPAGGRRPVARADASGGARVAFPLAARAEHVRARRPGAQRGLRRPSGAAARPRRLHRHDARAWACRWMPRQQYGVTVTDDATVGCDLDPQLQVFTSGAAGPATPGCDNWRGLWPFLIAGQRPSVVALGLGRWEVTDHLLDGRWVHIGEPAWDAHLTRRPAVGHRHPPLVWCQSGAVHHALRRPQ